jgi:hypothetical protein
MQFKFVETRKCHMAGMFYEVTENEVSVPSHHFAIIYNRDLFLVVTLTQANSDALRTHSSNIPVMIA